MLMLYFLLWCLLWPLVVAGHYLIMVRHVGVHYSAEALPRIAKTVGAVYVIVGLMLYLAFLLRLLLD